MMKNTLKIIFLFLSLLSYSQYIETGTIKLEKIDEPIHAKDIVYVNDKTIQFRNTDYPYVISFAKLKKIEKIDFDSTQYHQDIPNLSETFSENREGRAVYVTLEDLFTNHQTERDFRAKKIGYLYEFPGDLIDVKEGKEDKRIKDIAGVVYDGDTYISIKNMWDNESKENNNYVIMHEKNTFARVKYLNDSILYFDMPLKGMGNFILTTSLGMFGAIGGGVSAIVSTNVPDNYRPILMYRDNKEVFIIKNCKQFNEHFENKNKEIKIDCEKDYNLNSIRKEILTKL